MTSELATLRLRPAVHTHDVQDGRVRRHPQSHFLDFLIDGVSLVSTAHEQDNLVTDLNRDWVPDAVAPAVETLLGRRASPDLDAGRVPLLVCGSCGDLACGAVTAKLDVGTKEVTWSEFRWENGYEGPEPIDSLPDQVRFDRAQYEAELADAVHRVATLPESEPRFLERPRRGRHLRWPWKPRKD
ncbi:hypothetical protein [Blastococcus sp. TF02A-30]|uniref:hypothetical protein n=1 Tax=Blastococcus sp. TF02A-30 TaxID=2250580 RepID=UPI000DEC00DE|nr:hypothetical protein [Blastococcus sp. TF02A-30]RBY86449.1 hypothetical protein DQ241_13015 [Blastococcus sp. TF02A-30]